MSTLLSIRTGYAQEPTREILTAGNIFEACPCKISGIVKEASAHPLPCNGFELVASFHKVLTGCRPSPRKPSRLKLTLVPPLDKTGKTHMH